MGGYEVSSLLSSSASGDVYLAYQSSMDRTVALKIWSSSMVRDSARADRLLSEVNAASIVEHSKIASIYDAGNDDGCYYMAMSYVEGDSLEELLLKNGPISEDKAVRIAVEMVDILTYLWREHRLIHGAVSPRHIIMTLKTGATLLPVGAIIKVFSSEEIKEGGAGPVNYMSPEQVCVDESLDYHSDIFSLGMTLYSLLTGIIPFSAGSAEDAVNALLHSHLRDPRLDGVSISPGCMTMLEVMLARKKDNRYRNWGLLRKDFERVLKGQRPQKKRPPTEVSVLRRRVIVGGTSSRPSPGGGGESGGTGPGRHRAVRNTVSRPVRGINMVGERDAVAARAPRPSYSTESSNRGLWVVLSVIVFVVVLGFLILNSGNLAPWEKRPVVTREMRQQELEKETLENIEYYISSLMPGDPDAIDEAEKALVKMSGRAVSREVKAEIANAMEKISELRITGAENAWRRLSRKATALLQQEDKSAAIAMMRNYDGVYADALRDKREETVAGWEGGR